MKQHWLDEAEIFLGVDTVSVSWHCDWLAKDLRVNNDIIEAIGRHNGLLHDVQTRERIGMSRIKGGVRTIAHRGVTIGAYRRSDLVWMEGRLASLATGKAGPTGLAPWSAMCDLDGRARGYLRSIGIDPDTEIWGEPLPAHAKLRRLDLTADVRFGAGREDAAAYLLRALATLPVAGYRRRIEEGDGGVETVYLLPKRSRRIVARAYNKSLEAGLPDGVVRIELMLRRDEPRPLVKDFVATTSPAALWRQRLRTWAVPGERLVVSELEVAMRELERLRASGAITNRVFERQLGTLGAYATWGWAVPSWTTKTMRKRRAELRKIGVLPSFERPLGTEAIDLGPLFTRITEAWNSLS